jgi:hypothetical protein
MRIIMDLKDRIKAVIQEHYWSKAPSQRSMTIAVITDLQNAIDAEDD